MGGRLEMYAVFPDGKVKPGLEREASQAFTRSFHAGPCDPATSARLWPRGAANQTGPAFRAPVWIQKAPGQSWPRSPKPGRELVPFTQLNCTLVLPPATPWCWSETCVIHCLAQNGTCACHLHVMPANDWCSDGPAVPLDVDFNIFTMGDLTLDELKAGGPFVHGGHPVGRVVPGTERVAVARISRTVARVLEIHRKA